MKPFQFISILYLSATLHLITLSSFSSCADMNMYCDKQCSKAETFTARTDFNSNLKNLLDHLAKNAPLFRGYYSSSIGDSSNKIYGLVQCRGDISSINCGICIRNSSVFALNECPQSKDVIIWFSWCFLRYSTDDFIGVLGQISVAVSNETNYDDPSLVSKGLSLMSGLASSVPNQNLMFETDVFDGGLRGKRYGMAQCTRDISGSDCFLCLNSQLATFRTTIGSKKDWELYGFNCFMWYHDHQFYFNFSTSEGGRWSFIDGGRTIMFISFAVLMMIL